MWGGGAFSGVSDFINTKTKFSSKKYGVAASPRITSSKNTRKGGGRDQIGKPYKIAGKWYTPKHNPNYDSTGAASWYGPNFHGRQTANGEIFDQNSISAAHPTLPLPSYVRVTNLENNHSIMVRVNDRGPFVAGREIDLSKRAAEMLGYTHKGVARVRVKYISRAPLEGDDTRMLLASYNSPTRMERSQATNTRIAFAQAPARATKVPVFSAGNIFNGPRGNVTVAAGGFNIVNSVGADGLGPLFYAAPSGFDADKASLQIDSAFAAAEAMATRAGGLESWRATIDEDARKIRLELGVFTNRTNAQKVMQSFALIGAVNEDMLTIGNRDATRLTLVHLKPGVTRKDAAERIQQLGLKEVILYE